MAKDWKDRLGMVYSTNPDFQFQYNEKQEEQETLTPSKQDLRVMRDSKQRKGKTVSLVTGFIGSEEDLKKLGKMIKSKIGVGGTAKDGDIIIQGDFVDKIIEILVKQGYKVKKAGG
ncbi:MAG: translation initiation factor [Bacteroidales bacterium]